MSERPSLAAALGLEGVDPRDLLPLLLFHLVLAAAVAWQGRHLSFTDDYAYLLNARHYAAGEPWRGVSGCWSPMLTWALVPAWWLSDAPHMVHRALCAGFGLLAVLGAWAMGVRLGLRGPWRVAAVAALSVRIVYASVRVATPDVLTLALLLAYVFLVTAPALLRDRRLLTATGVVAGVAALTKAYCLPFVLVHFPLTAWLRARRAGPGALPLRSVLARVLGLLLLFTAPWMVVLGLHFGTPTWTTAGRINHAIAGPDWPYGKHPFERRLWEVEEGSLFVWEDPSHHDYAYWSPLEHPGHQALVVLQGLYGVYFNQVWLDPLRLRLLAFLLLPILCLARREPEQERRLHRLLLLTLAVFLAGYVPLCGQSPRYQILAVVLTELLSVRLVMRLLAHLDAGRGARLLALALLFLGRALPASLEIARLGPQVRVGDALHRLAEDLEGAAPELDVWASTRYGDFYLAYLLGDRFAGVPAARDRDELARELRAAGVGGFLLWSEDPRAGWIRGAPFLELLRTVPAPAPDSEDAFGFQRAAGDLLVHRVRLPPPEEGGP